VELALCEVAAPEDGKDGEERVNRVCIEFVRLMEVVILEIDDGLEADASVWLNRGRDTSTRMKVSSH
jgi:hypothetical protein